MPALFIEHGSPMSLDDKAWQDDLRRIALGLTKPKCVLIFSAHWEEPSLHFGATESVPLEYDFHGFPERYYRVGYAPPPAPGFANRVEELIQEFEPARRTRRGLDHGAFIPLLAMYPEADIPVLQMALPSKDPRRLLSLGRALAPLRDEGVLILGAGYLIHNLRLVRMEDRDAQPPPWALEFDAWAADALTRKDPGALARFRSEAPHVRQALPTDEHFLPLFLPLGAAAPEEPVGFPITGFLYGSLDRRSVRWG
jgi:4,5-DOPA dioxygenase extradiol